MIPNLRYRKKLLERTEPPHKEPDPYSCSCVSCEDWRAVRVITGSLVIGIKLNPARSSGSGSPTWHPAGPFIWGDPVSEAMIVLGDVPETSPGGHLDAVLLWNETMGFRVTSRKWLLVVA